jgi:hypothetical protein
MKKREYKNNRPILEHQFLEIWPGLPDGILSNQKIQFGSIFEGLDMAHVGLFYVH